MRTAPIVIVFALLSDARRARVVALASILLAAGAAGCVTPASDIDAANIPQTASEALPHLELSDEHDHADHASHRVAWNARALGWDPVAPDVTKLGRYNHVTRHGDVAFITAYSVEAGGAPGVAIYDVSGDQPVQLATLETPTLTPIDVSVSEDGKYVALAGHRDNRAPATPAAAQTCTGTPGVNLCTPYVPGGVLLVDVSEPASPKLVAEYTSPPSGAHTVKIHQIGGDYWVFMASYGFSYANRIASSVEIARVDEDSPLGTVIEPVTRFFPGRASGEAGDSRLFVHDMTIVEHELTKQTLMYVAYWDGGVVIADVSDPANPTQVADWTDFDAGTYGNIHYARPVGMIGDKHITVAAPEFGSAEHAGEAYVLDTTDPTKPELLTKWTLPGDPVNDGGYRFSPHNFDPMGTRIAYAHYHGGVWVLDLADPEYPTVDAYFLPAVPEGTPEFESEEDAPNVWTAIWTERGTILASDIGTGLHHYEVLDGEGVPPYEAFLG